MLKAGDLARREDHRVRGVKSGRIRRDCGISHVWSNRVVSLSKAHLLPLSTGNTQEAAAPSQHD